MTPIEELKVGDTVLLRSGYGYCRYEKYTIERVLKLHIVLKDMPYAKFRRDNGYEAGSAHTRRSVVLFDEAVWAKQVLSNRREYLRHTFEWERCPDDVVNAVFALVKPESK